MKVKVLSRIEVETGDAEGADAVISIRSPTTGREPEFTAALAQATQGESARLLRLAFDDCGVAGYGHYNAPTIAQIQDAIDFGRAILDGRTLFGGPVADPLLVVHCEQGRSRSSAVALALLADHHGAGHERDAVNELLRGDIENRIFPNPLVVLHADACLLRSGRLEAALAELSPRYVMWRRYWQQVALDPVGHWQREVAARQRRRRRTA
ncbi:MAG TPA: hypothetical protein VKQ29_13150 [Aliidongia sp.]|nr:hypothetical protein [Aliidongia sp.]